MVSRVLNTVLMLYPFQDPPDLLALSFDVGNFSGGEWFSTSSLISLDFRALHLLRKPMG